MKHFCLSLLFSVTGFFAFAQMPETFRITLKEKINLPLRYMPIEFIRAYCEGNIKAYYPLDTTKECSYHEFVSHFDLGTCQPVMTGDNWSSAPCPKTFCATNDIDMLDNFLSYIELVQVKYFDNTLSREITRVVLVKLKFVYFDEFRKEERILEGPVFKYSDIAQLEKDYLIPNPNNDAEKFTIKRVLDSRLFNGYVLKPYGMPQNKPVNSDFNREQDNSEH